MKAKSIRVGIAALLTLSTISAQAYLRPMFVVKVDFDKATSKLVLTLSGRNLEQISDASLDVRCSGVQINDVEPVPESFQRRDGNLQFTMPIPTHGTNCKYDLLDKTSTFVSEATRRATWVDPKPIDLSALGAGQALQAAIDSEKASASDTSAADSSNASGNGAPTVTKADLIYVSVTRDSSSYLYNSSTFVSGLGAEAFQLFATNSQGQRVQLHRSSNFIQQRLPMTLGLLIDDSGSMKEGSAGASTMSKHDYAVTAGNRIIEAMASMTVDNRKSNGFVINFNSDNTGNKLNFNNALLNPPKTPDTAVKLLVEDPQQLSDWVGLAQTSRNSTIQIHGDTPMRDAIGRAVDEIVLARQYDDEHPSPELEAKRTKYVQEAFDHYLAKHPGMTQEQASVATDIGLENWQMKEIDDLRRNGGHTRGRGVLFVVSDGNDNTRGGLRYEDLARKVRDANIQVYGINFASAQGTSENDLLKIAEYSGGEAISIPSTANSLQVSDTVKNFSDQVVQSLLNQYYLDFTDPDQECRKLDVVVRDLTLAPQMYENSLKTIYDRERDAAYKIYEGKRSTAAMAYEKIRATAKAGYANTPQAAADDTFNRTYEIGKYAPKIKSQASVSMFDEWKPAPIANRSKATVEAICSYWKSQRGADEYYLNYRFCGPWTMEQDFKFDVEGGQQTIGQDRIIAPPVHDFTYPDFVYSEYFNFPTMKSWSTDKATFDQWYSKKIVSQDWINQFPTLNSHHIPTIGICNAQTLQPLASRRNQ